MRIRDISHKEVIDARAGQKLGAPGAIDLIIDETTGKIEALVLPAAPSLPFRKKAKEWVIPWESIQRIGEDFIIIDPHHVTN
ncbi:YlmC/YmxH family sporulation protein [Bacillus piscicola]|uniref:YlmC/YmxH family sporulation protein n=1 Tax=Bacillus piscicola TaxID=1632684 RepID=UPI001F092A1E|nr:YlmC/YmxH family sporulation protein [Bacillus piscicola]